MQGNTIKLGFHGATSMHADLQTDVAAAAQAGFKVLELWAAKVDVPPEGAKLDLNPGDLDKNLDRKTPSKAKQPRRLRRLQPQRLLPTVSPLK